MVIQMKYEKEYMAKPEVKARRKIYEKEWESKRVICECGREVGRGWISRHKKTKIHLDLMKNLL